MRGARLGRGIYFGVDRARVAVGPFEFTQTVYRHGERQDHHQHDDPTAFIVLSGSVAERTKAGWSHHPPLTAVFNPAGLEHQAAFHGASPRVLNIQFRSEWLDANDAAARRVVPRPFAAPAVARLCRLLLPGAEPDASLETTMNALLSPPQEVRGDRPQARQAAEMINERSDLRARVSQVAAELGVERTRLAHAFRREHGISLREYASRLRFAEACDLLANDQAPLAHIAADAGYADQSHMTRDFRRRAGMTPGQCRGVLQSQDFTFVQDAPFGPS